MNRLTEIRRPSDWRRIYLLQHPLAVTLAIGAVVIAFTMLTHPALLAETTLAGALPEGLEYAWIALFGIGGALCLAGYWRLSGRLEISGLIAQASCYFAYVLVIVDQRGESGAILLCVTAFLALGMTARAVVIITQPEVRPWARRL